MFTPSATRHGITMVAATAISLAILPYGAAAADPSQDDQFLAVLQDKQIPAMENVATVVAAGHKVCQKLDDGVPARTVLDGLNNDAYGMNPDLREQADRLSATMSRFIAAAVEVYCPGDQSKIASLAASHTRQPTGPAHLLVVANYRTTPGSGGKAADGLPADAHGAALGSPVGDLATGDASQPKPPKIPPLKAPEAKIPRSPGAVTKPPPRQQPPPPPQQSPPPPPAAPPEPPPQQIPSQLPPPPPQGPPAPAGPQPGSATDGNGGGNGGSGGGGADTGSPAAPPPAPPRAPGMIQLVPW